MEGVKRSILVTNFGNLLTSIFEFYNIVIDTYG